MSDLFVLFENTYKNFEETMVVDGCLQLRDRFACLYDIVDTACCNLEDANADDKIDNDSYNIMYGVIWSLYATGFIEKPEFESMLHCLRYYKEQIDEQ